MVGKSCTKASKLLGFVKVNIKKPRKRKTGGNQLNYFKLNGKVKSKNWKNKLKADMLISFVLIFLTNI